jgi:hypothetical protein
MLTIQIFENSTFECFFRRSQKCINDLIKQIDATKSKHILFFYFRNNVKKFEVKKMR